MLVSSPIQGYKAISIFFYHVGSGWIIIWLFVVAGNERLKKTVAKNSCPMGFDLSLFICYWSLHGSHDRYGTSKSYVLITPSIYYLFPVQWLVQFLQSVLAILYQILSKRVVLLLWHGYSFYCKYQLNPSFVYFLWNQPGIVFNIIGGIGAVLQLVFRSIIW